MPRERGDQLMDSDFNPTGLLRVTNCEIKRDSFGSFKIVLCPPGAFDLELVRKEEMSEPTDLRTICSALEHSPPPAALCSIQGDA